MDKITLKLNDYSAANLRWVLAEIANDSRYNDLNTGDWNLEVLFDLEFLMEEAGSEFVDYQPNGQDPYQNKPTYPFISWGEKPESQK